MIVAEDLLSHSKELYSQKANGEVILRNSARSAYYALFHKLSAIEFNSKISSSDRSYGSHELLIEQLRTSEILEYKELGLLLSRLKPIRTKADYKLDQRFSDNDAYSTIRKVEKVFQKLSLSKTSQDNPAAEPEVTNEVPEVVKEDKPAYRPTLKVIK